MVLYLCLWNGLRSDGVSLSKSLDDFPPEIAAEALEMTIDQLQTAVDAKSFATIYENLRHSSMISAGGNAGIPKLATHYLMGYYECNMG